MYKKPHYKKTVLCSYFMNFYVAEFIFILNLKVGFLSVSHTTDDLVFEWLPDEEIPLVVEPGTFYLEYQD